MSLHPDTAKCPSQNEGIWIERDGETRKILCDNGGRDGSDRNLIQRELQAAAVTGRRDELGWMLSRSLQKKPTLRAPSISSSDFLNRESGFQPPQFMVQFCSSPDEIKQHSLWAMVSAKEKT